MKTIDVNIYACYGYGCCGGSYSSEETVKVEVSDEVAATIKSMQSEYKEVNHTVFEKAIQEEHQELKSVYDAIAEKHKDIVARYWLFEADNDCIDDSLEPSFWEDIEKGLYKPEKTLEECIKDLRSQEKYPDRDLDDEEQQRYCFYDEYCHQYLDWVNSNEDYYFIAKRTGLDLSVVYEDMPDLEFVVNPIK